MVVPVLEKLAAPWMEKRVPGVEVPMPKRLLVASTVRKSADDTALELAG